MQTWDFNFISMSWLTNIVPPKIKALITRKKDVPDNLWTKCSKCDHMLFHRDLAANFFVCHYCQKHMRLNAFDRLNSLYDNQQYIDVPIDNIKDDPLHFRDSKRYRDRLKTYRQKTNRKDSASVSYGKIGGKDVVTYLLDFEFMGGSMGTYAGKGMVVAANMAIKTNATLLAITSSGGARMQEGILSLMQMPRTTVAVQQVKEAGLPYITLLTDPTTGGVSASFAMLGDISIAEPGATIGFTGARVVQDTMKQQLPEGFQTSEYLLEHGMIDMIVHRHKLAKTISTLLGHIQR